MATLHIPEAEAAHDLRSLLQRVRQGDQIFIDSEDGCIAMLVPVDETAVGFDPEYDEYIRAKVQRSMDDPRPGIPSEEVEAYFARRKAATALKMLQPTG